MDTRIQNYSRTFMPSFGFNHGELFCEAEDDPKRITPKSVFMSTDSGGLLVVLGPHPAPPAFQIVSL